MALTLDQFMRTALGYRGTVTVAGQKLVIQKSSPFACNKKYISGKGVQVRRWVKGTDPRSPAQQQQRSKLAQAVAAWHTATPAEREAYQYKARWKNISRYQAFIGEFMKQIIITPGTSWDSGTTFWDLGNTLWDISNPTTWDAGSTEWDFGATLWDS